MKDEKPTLRYFTRRPILAEEELNIIQFYLAPHNLRHTADIFHRCIPAIKKVLLKNKVPLHDSKIKQLCAENKNKQTCLEKYGVEYSFQSENNKDKSKQTCLAKYGVDNAAKAASVQDKIKETCEVKYGVKNVMQNELIKNTSNQQRLFNGTLNTSKQEDQAYDILIEKYGTSDVYRNYNQDTRYPFHCDFYIKSLDLFIELNLHWTHGGHEFNETEQADINKLTIWKSKAINNVYYASAIEVWTKTDKLKIKTAKNNTLKYIMIYNSHDILNLLKIIERKD